MNTYILSGLRWIFPLLALACTSCREKPQSLDAQQPREVSVMLSWTPSAEHAFLYLGQQRGYFKENGITLKIVPSRGSRAVQLALEGGVVTFGFISGDILAQARTQGVRLRAFAVLFHESPVTLYYKRELGIKSPADLRHKTVGCLFDSATYAQYRLMLKIQGLDPDSITEVPSKGSPNEISNDMSQVAMHYTQYAPVQLRTQGIEIDELLLKDWGVNVISTTLATTDQTLANNRPLVVAFAKACIQSLYAMHRDPEAAVKALIAAEPTIGFNEATKSLAIVDKLIFNAQAKARGPGYLSHDEWQATQEVMHAAEIKGERLIKEKIDPDFFFDASILEDVKRDLKL